MSFRKIFGRVYSSNEVRSFPKNIIVSKVFSQQASKNIQSCLFFLVYISIALTTFHLAGCVQPAFAQGAPNFGVQPAGIKQLEQLITRIINLTVPIAFIALTVVLVMAGIKFITSGGEPKAIGAAGQTITWAFLGILFMVLAWLILSLIQAFTGVNVTNFGLCTFFPGGVCP